MQCPRLMHLCLPNDGRSGGRSASARSWQGLLATARGRGEQHRTQAVQTGQLIAKRTQAALFKPDPPCEHDRSEVDFLDREAFQNAVASFSHASQACIRLRNSRPSARALIGPSNTTAPSTPVRTLQSCVMEPFIALGKSALGLRSLCAVESTAAACVDSTQHPESIRSPYFRK